jgi:hypothetical protein
VGKIGDKELDMRLNASRLASWVDGSETTIMLVRAYQESPPHQFTKCFSRPGCLLLIIMLHIVKTRKLRL